MPTPVHPTMRSWYRSWYHDRHDARITTQESLGGYTHPILADGGEYEIIQCRAPRNQEEYAWLIGQMRNKCILSYVDGNKITLVRAGFTLADLGIKILTRDSSTGKTVKRAKTLARAFRIHTSQPSVCVRIIKGGPELDGACFAHDFSKYAL